MEATASDTSSASGRPINCSATGPPAQAVSTGARLGPVQHTGKGSAGAWRKSMGPGGPSRSQKAWSKRSTSFTT